MTAKEAADYIFEHMAEFETEYAGTIAKFEDMGIDHTTAKAMAITLAANAKVLTDALAD